MVSLFFEDISVASPVEDCTFGQGCTQDSDCKCGYLTTMCTGGPQGQCIERLDEFLGLEDHSPTANITEAPTKKSSNLRKNKNKKMEQKSKTMPCSTKAHESHKSPNGKKKNKNKRGNRKNKMKSLL